MDMEARSFSPDKSRQLLLKVKEYKADLGKLKDDAKKAVASGADIRCGSLCSGRCPTNVAAGIRSPLAPVLPW